MHILIIVLLVFVGRSALAEELTYTGDCSNGCASGESFTHTNANEINTAVDDNAADIDALQAVDPIIETEMDASSELRALIDDETGTGAIVFAGGAIGAATATTPSADDSDTSVATTAYVQGEINGAGGTDLTCSSGTCNVDAAITRDSEVSALTTSTSDPTDASDSCDTGDMWLNTSGFTIFFCTDGSTDKWYGVNLSDSP